jgi:hypothetical protein
MSEKACGVKQICYLKNMKNFIVIYLDDSNDMHMAQFDRENDAMRFMEDKLTKFVVIHGNISGVDMANAS